MSKLRKLWIRWTFLLADLYLISVVIQVFVLQGGSPSAAYWPWLAEVSTILFLNTILRQRAATYPVVIGCNVIGALITGTSSLFVFPQADFSFLRQVVLIILTAAPAAHSAMLTDEEPGQQQNVLYLDAAVAATALILFLADKGTLFPTDGLILLGKLTCLALLLSLILSRVGKRPGASHSGRSFAGALILGGLLLLSFLFAVLAASHFQGISSGIVGSVVWLCQQLLQVLRAFGNKVGSFFLWLLSLFPAKDEDWIPPEPESTAIMMEETAADSYDTIALILLILLGIAAMAGIACLLYRLRGKRWQEKSLEERAVPNLPRKNGFRDQLQKLWQKMKQNLRFELSYLRNRRTPAGLLVWTERKLRSTSLSRRESESPPAFLRRLDTQVSMPDKQSPPPNVQAPLPDFQTLANLLERQFYRRTEEALPSGFYREYKKSFVKAKRREK